MQLNNVELIYCFIAHCVDTTHEIARTFAEFWMIFHDFKTMRSETKGKPSRPRMPTKIFHLHRFITLQTVKYSDEEANATHWWSILFSNYDIDFAIACSLGANREKRKCYQLNFNQNKSHTYCDNFKWCPTNGHKHVRARHVILLSVYAERYSRFCRTFPII